MNRFQRLAARLLGIEAMPTVPPEILESFRRTVSDHLARVAEHPIDSAGIKPPGEHEYPWESWRNEMHHMGLEGWAPCRFGNLNPETNMVWWVFGIAWADFGIWKQPRTVCGDLTEQTILSFVTHLPTGLGLGMFESNVVAAKASTIADPIIHGVEVDRDWAGRKERLFETWRFHGIERHPDRHVHDPQDNEEMPIWCHVPDAEQPKPTVNA